MIQRVQSVWLLLAAICAALMFIWPLYGGTLPGGVINYFMANASFSLMLVIGIVAILPFIAIFFYKNRQTQMKLVWLAMLTDIGLAILTYVKTSAFAMGRAFTSGGYKATTILPIIIFIFLVLALRGIRADNKLVKSVDRFRN